MIAKSLLVTFLLAMGIGLHAKSPYETNYFNILKEYEIHPPMLKYGYPLWYQYDSLPITGIIYLKDDLTDLHKINDITYVAEPTKENAEIILNFSGEAGLYPKFYIVPDSALEWRKVIEFLELLVPDYRQTNFLLCGEQNRYFNFFVVDESYAPGRPVGCIMSSNLLSVVNNCKGDILVDGQKMDSDSLNSRIEEFYLGNYYVIKQGDKFINYNERAMRRTIVDTSSCLEVIEFCENKLLALDTESFLNERALYHSFIAEYRQKLYHAREWKRLLIPREDDEIRFNFMHFECDLAGFYAFADKLNEGVYLTREKRARNISLFSYKDMVKCKNAKYLDYIHLEFPDLIEHRFLRFPEPLPVPF